MRLRSLLLLLLLLGWRPTLAQTASQRAARVEILHADEWTFDGRIPGAQRLLGNVRFRHVDAVMNCDSAYLFEDQRVQAFGHVRVQQGDSLLMEGERLNYSGQERLASMQGDVRLRDKDMYLTTPSLDYDLRNKKAWYTEGGRIEDQSSANVLTSGRGTYFSESRHFAFSRRVRLEHPERLITCDTMHYATGTGIASFFGPTRILQYADSSVVRTTRGTYDTRLERARFQRRTSVSTKGRLLEGDSIHYDRISGAGHAWGNVLFSDSANATRARGAEGIYNDRTERTIVTGMAVLELAMDGDTLYIHGDTLFTTTTQGVDTAGLIQSTRNVTVRRNVRFFKSDLQGSCDTLHYTTLDSVIHMHHRPVLWSRSDQISGEHIRINLREGRPDTLFVDRNAFLLSEVDSAHLDQVTGLRMVGLFDGDGLRRLFVEGNTRTVYHVKEKKEEVEVLVGVNRADCSRMLVSLADGGISTVTFLERPEAVLYPMDKVPPEELRMKGAEWRGAERPVDANDIFRR